MSSRPTPIDPSAVITSVDLSAAGLTMTSEQFNWFRKNHLKLAGHGYTVKLLVGTNRRVAVTKPDGEKLEFTQYGAWKTWHQTTLKDIGA